LVVMGKQQQAPGELEHVRAFVNTVDLEDADERLNSGRALAQWLVSRGLAPSGLRVGGDDLRRAIELREALRTLLLAHNGESLDSRAALATLDATARRARIELRFSSDGAVALEPRAAGVAGSLGRLLAIVYRSIEAGTWERLKACRQRSCAWAFYDHTKNRSGTWCNMAVCGNRAKARSYRHRQGAARAPAGERRRPPAGERRRRSA
jgi:predicted RNA-binding Zn ribbon-like protein